MTGIICNLEEYRNPSCVAVFGEAAQDVIPLNTGFRAERVRERVEANEEREAWITRERQLKYYDRLADRFALKNRITAYEWTGVNERKLHRIELEDKAPELHEKLEKFFMRKLQIIHTHYDIVGAGVYKAFLGDDVRIVNSYKGDYAPIGTGWNLKQAIASLYEQLTVGLAPHERIGWKGRYGVVHYRYSDAADDFFEVERRVRLVANGTPVITETAVPRAKLALVIG